MPLFFSLLSVILGFVSFLYVLDIVVAHVVVRVILRIGVYIDVRVGLSELGARIVVRMR